MPEPIPIPILSRPGVKRDGTRFEGDHYTDALWARFQRGLPRKMGGYRQLLGSATGRVRAIDGFAQNNYLYIHLGSQTRLERFIIDASTFAPTGITNRSPGALATSDDNLWQFEQMYDATGGVTQLIAHAAPNAADIASNVATSVYYGDVTGVAAPSAIVDGVGAAIQVSGGVVALHPYLLMFGSDGIVRQSVANQPSNFIGVGSNTARPTAKKIVRGLPLRGGAANSPAGLLWSLDGLIKASFVGGAAVFSYDAISNQGGIVAPNSVIEHDGVYYWVGVGRFMMFNGIVQELPNPLNKNFFYNNMNWAHAAKTFAFKVPEFGEIWFCFPRSPSTEPNWAVIYNVTERTWYDTELPNAGRSAGQLAPCGCFPLLAGSTLTAGASVIWQHEIGVDEISGSPQRSSAIRSYFETGDVSAVSPPEGGRPINRALRCVAVEPDFVQTGDMSVQVSGRSNARAAEVLSAVRTFPAAPTESYQQRVTFHGDGLRRELRFRFESNVAGGDYQMGRPLAHVAPADGTTLGGVA